MYRSSVRQLSCSCESKKKIPHKGDWDVWRQNADQSGTHLLSEHVWGMGTCVLWGQWWWNERHVFTVLITLEISKAIKDYFDIVVEVKGWWDEVHNFHFSKSKPRFLPGVFSCPLLAHNYGGTGYLCAPRMTSDISWKLWVYSLLNIHELELERLET